MLKGTMLWCARWMVGDGEFYRGRTLSVEVSARGLGESITVKPARGVDGVADPELLRVPGAGADGQEVVGADPSELLRVMFSADEKSILRALVGHEPSKAADVLDRCRGAVEKSKFWTLWGNLQHRGVVGDGEESEGGGFVVALAWVREIIQGETAARGKPAA